MGAKMSVIELIMSFLPYLRSAMARFPLENINLCVTSKYFVPKVEIHFFNYNY